MLAIIGGTGVYKLDGIEILESLDVETPFGVPSASIIRAKIGKHEVLFLPRHGEHHQFLPHEINYQANIFALKKCGVKQILGLSAIGSLREELKPGDFVIPSQYIDWVKGDRKRTFFGQGVSAHVSTAIPTCENLTKWIVSGCNSLGFTVHTDKTYVCVDGPRLGTKAESNFMRSIGADVVGMTNVPEVFLAREAQLCYATIGMVTDYDCWMDDPTCTVTVSAIIQKYGETLERAKSLLSTLFETDLPPIDSTYRESLNDALLTPLDAIPESKKEMLSILKQ